MGLFSFNYNKPGPGIDKDAPQKKGIFRYFEIFGRKFWKLMQANMLAFVCSLPFMAIMFMLAPVSTDAISAMLPSISTEELATVQLMLRFFFTSVIFFLWGSGPASAGYAYITRCFTREQHAWIWSDFKDRFKENFKQGMIVTVVDILMSYLAIYGIYFYFMTYKSTGNNLWFFACCLMCTLLVLYTFMHYYIYQFMVTFTEKTTRLYRNALIFAISQLPMCIFLTLLTLAISFLMFNTLNPVFAMFLNIFIGMTLMRFPIEYRAARAVEKKLLPKAPQITYDEPDEGEI